ncbi:hypothetical protein CC1G_06080 [Coprinopsis cinerea okayama7|uniref:Uncharacterized protein n=1 Tax=Coprinopsis cinerea (strain Okayama-7 / 130 / ATCC MYA-4618 / FGSC 9003) TaxID=240176 RepID=A8PA30_COPC7|nr:hypothetical protein CC1G_06080 [Coprinopsis cinerea okayama7\|eukprot:XP_001839890.2 hypothetical protein CC1G_06080 [Coprinopsis cinerea okayama7\
MSMPPHTPPSFTLRLMDANGRMSIRDPHRASRRELLLRLTSPATTAAAQHEPPTTLPPRHRRHQAPPPAPATDTGNTNGRVEYRAEYVDTPRGDDRTAHGAAENLGGLGWSFEIILTMYATIKRAAMYLWKLD